jgi:hypothetical protein
MVFCYNANDRTAENKIPNGMSFELLFMTQRPIIFPTPFLIAQKRFLTGKESSERANATFSF